MGNLPKNATMDPVLLFGITIIGATRGGGGRPLFASQGWGPFDKLYISTLLKRGEVKCENDILKEK